MAFQEFNKMNVLPAARRNVAEASVLKSGVLSFNSLAIAMLQREWDNVPYSVATPKSKEVEALVFYYDPDAKIIGFKPCRGDSKNALPLRGKSKERLFVSIVSFLRHYDIDFSTTKRYLLKQDSSRMFYCKLDEGQPVVITRKPKTDCCGKCEETGIDQSA